MLGIALVLWIYADSAAHWTAVVRPVVIIALIGATAAGAAMTLSRSPFWAAMAGSLAVTFGLGDELLGWVIVEMGLLWLTLRQWRRVRRAPSPVAPMEHMTLVAALFLGIAIVNLALSGAVTLEDFRVDTVSSEPSSSSHGALPNIYVMLLDAYPRGDTLADLGHDNGQFSDELEGIGFTVYPDATADFQRTELTLISMLSDDADELQAIEFPEWPAVVHTWRSIRRELFHDLPALDSLRSLGYRLTYVASPIHHTDLPGWDERIDTGQLTGLEVDLVQRSVLGPVLGQWVLDQHRERVEASISAWASQAERSGLRAVLAHVLSPHTPFVFRGDGSSQEPLDCWSSQWCSIYQSTWRELHLSEGVYSEMLVGQVKHLDTLILKAASDVIAADPDAVVILLSDHGARFSDEPAPEWHRTFLAARIPGHPGVLADDPGPDGLFSRIIDAVSQDE